ncbi:SiaB family protein kinase [Paracrocinitomix mangrovi]|uniref:SiaB family protein kinase n=1 Tax=Paracrocinitomix mangrovi TaxID=2862509 RepID=UPI001C8D7B64|nr:SiaB family protein kinase [Paracrocinitomix mangrovi]UKN03692.1 SiaB family protein kinase [Paracrocinitomix mangrovi]
MEKYDYDLFTRDDLSMWYKGSISDDITENLIGVAESDANKLGKSKKKVSFLMAESFQNIVRHSIKDLERRTQASFGITNREGEIHIFSANYVSKEEGDKISEKLQNVNGLKSEELNDQYRRILSDGTFSERGGAGLGLISMAKKSGRPLQYALMPINDRAEFCLQIDKAISEENQVTNMPVDESVQIHKYLEDKGVVLFFKGEFDYETTENMVKMFRENSEVERSKKINRAIFHVGIELITNITRHGLSKDGKTNGCFIMSLVNNEVVLTTKNYVDPSKHEEFEEHLAEINTKTKQELCDWYKSRMRNNMLTEGELQGLGLMNVAKKTSNPIKYYFESSLEGVEGIIEVRIPLN